jgi:hypothetical protein
VTPEIILKKLFILAEMTRHELSEELAELYLSALQRIEPEAVSSVLDRMIMSRSGREGFPTIGDIVEQAKPKTEPQDDAIEAASLIWGSIAKFGRTNPKEAKAHMGDLAWEIVQRLGGWSSVCTTEASQRASFIAQARQLGEAVSKKALLGSLEDRPALGPHHRLITSIAEKRDPEAST